MSEVRILKLVTTEEIIGTVDYNEDGSLVITNPTQLILQPRRNDDGSQGLGTSLIPYASGSDEPVVIETKFIIYDVKPNADLEKMFRKIHGMIEVPPSKLVTVK